MLLKEQWWGNLYLSNCTVLNALDLWLPEPTQAECRAGLQCLVYPSFFSPILFWCFLWSKLFIFISNNIHILSYCNFKVLNLLMHFNSFPNTYRTHLALFPTFFHFIFLWSPVLFLALWLKWFSSLAFIHFLLDVKHRFPEMRKRSSRR